MSKHALIQSIKARPCYNSRGEETIEVDVVVDGYLGRACSPAGASVGRHEAVGFPAGGVKATIAQLDRYSQKLLGFDATDTMGLTKILREIDGSENYARIGGSAAYAVSIATAEAASKAHHLPLYRVLKPEGPHWIPFPLGNVLGGGKHAGPGAPDIQEILVCPIGAVDIHQALTVNFAVHREVRKQAEMKDKTFTGGRGDEGAWVPNLTDEKALEAVSTAAKRVSDHMGVETRLGVDIASSSMWSDAEGKYVCQSFKRSPGEQIDYVTKLVKSFHLFYVEDPLHEEAFEEFSELTKKLKGVFIVGDDLLVTNSSRLQRAASLRAGNAAILKVNQAGSLGDALRFASTARNCDFVIITSHRSGDTPDSQISHIAVATESKMIKTGIVGGERVSKLNELIRICEFEDVMGMVGFEVLRG